MSHATHLPTPRQGSRVSKDEAVQRLLAAGHAAEAKKLQNWRNKNGTNWGWDGHVQGMYPALVPIIWPS
jgi:hypothetical protein